MRFICNGVDVHLGFKEASRAIHLTGLPTTIHELHDSLMEEETYFLTSPLSAETHHMPTQPTTVGAITEEVHPVSPDVAMVLSPKN